MIIAIPVFGREISPRFDCSREMLLFRVERGRVVEERPLAIKDETHLLNRVRILSARKVERILCGGIDEFSVRALNGAGIRVLSWASGNARAALEAFLAGRRRAGKAQKRPPGA